MIYSLEGSIQSSQYSVPDLTRALRIRKIPYPPTLDGLVSSCTHALCADGPEEPLSFMPGSTKEQDFIDPPSHAWRHLQTQSVRINGQLKTARLFVADVSGRRGTNELGEDQYLHGNGMFRVLVTHNATIDHVDELGATTPSEAVLSIDNIPHWHVYAEDDDDDHEPDTAAGVICKIPASVVADMMTKLDNPGDATISELHAKAFVKDIKEVLSYHVDGVGTVGIEDWPVPQWNEPDELYDSASPGPSQYADEQ